VFLNRGGAGGGLVVVVANGISRRVESGWLIPAYAICVRPSVVFGGGAGHIAFFGRPQPARQNKKLERHTIRFR